MDQGDVMIVFFLLQFLLCMTQQLDNGGFVVIITVL